jgi:hypothetical protein
MLVWGPCTMIELSIIFLDFVKKILGERLKGVYDLFIYNTF